MRRFRRCCDSERASGKAAQIFGVTLAHFSDAQDPNSQFPHLRNYRNPTVAMVRAIQ
jgi:hypothetical protein